MSVVAGEVFDVAVDLRRSSPTFGRWVGLTLLAENRRQAWAPPGFAHGFCVTSDWAEVCYKVTDFYHPEYERTLLWNDPRVGVAWPLDGGSPLLSAKDAQGSAAGGGGGVRLTARGERRGVSPPVEPSPAG